MRGRLWRVYGGLCSRVLVLWLIGSIKYFEIGGIFCIYLGGVDLFYFLFILAHAASYRVDESFTLALTLGR